MELADSVPDIPIQWPCAASRAPIGGVFTCRGDEKEGSRGSIQLQLAARCRATFLAQKTCVNFRLEVGIQGGTSLQSVGRAVLQDLHRSLRPKQWRPQEGQRQSPGHSKDEATDGMKRPSRPCGTLTERSWNFPASLHPRETQLPQSSSEAVSANVSRPVSRLHPSERNLGCRAFTKASRQLRRKARSDSSRAGRCGQTSLQLRFAVGLR